LFSKFRNLLLFYQRWLAIIVIWILVEVCWKSIPVVWDRPYLLWLSCNLCLGLVWLFQREDWFDRNVFDLFGRQVGGCDGHLVLQGLLDALILRMSRHVVHQFLVILKSLLDLTLAHFTLLRLLLLGLPWMLRSNLIWILLNILYILINSHSLVLLDIDKELLSVRSNLSTWSCLNVPLYSLPVFAV